MPFIYKILLRGIDILCGLCSEIPVMFGFRLGGIAMNSGCATFAFCIGAMFLTVGTSKAIEVTQLVDICEQKSGPQAIAACDAVIDSRKYAGTELANVYYRRAALHAQAQQLSLAIKDYTAALRLHPDFVEALSERGSAYTEIGMDDLAVADFSSAIKLAPKLPWGYVLRATVYSSKGQYEEALADLDLAIPLMQRNSPSLARALALRGMTNEMLHRDEAAEADFNDGMSLSAKDPMLLHGACWIRVASGKHLDAALNFCNQALLLIPGDVGYRDTRALLYLRMGRLPDARKEYDAVLKARPDYAHALFGRGITKIRMGNKAGGQADIAAAVKIDPHMADEFKGYGIKP